MSRTEYTMTWGKCIGSCIMVVLVIVIASHGSVPVTLILSGILLVLGCWLLWVKDWQWRRSYRKEQGR